MCLFQKTYYPDFCYCISYRIMLYYYYTYVYVLNKNDSFDKIDYPEKIYLLICILVRYMRLFLLASLQF